MAQSTRRICGFHIARGNPVSKPVRVRNIFLILIGVVGLLLKRWMAVSIGEAAYCYLGNLSVSFAVYFIISIGARRRFSKLLLVWAALTVVEAFELTNGFGIMSNVYDPLDLLANAIGIVFALAMDVVLDHLQVRRLDAT